MNHLVFEVQAPVVSADPNRADIACFVGFVARRDNAPLPAPVASWLEEQGWNSRYRPEIQELLDVPVPVDSWEVFDHLFEWERRPLDESDRFGATYLGAAVRSFFAQGGRKCYVVRVGDPWPYLTKSPEGLSQIDAGLYARCHRVSKIGKLIPGFRMPRDCFSTRLPSDALKDYSRLESSPVEQASWRGVAHLFGLPDVSFLCLPDLPELVRVEDAPVDPIEFPQKDPEVFVDCSDGEEAPLPDRSAHSFGAPRCDDEGYRIWKSALMIAANLLALHQREVQLVAAIPIPDQNSSAERNLYEFLARADEAILSFPLDDSLTGLASPFVQLAYPWARTPGSVDLPEQLESPDAVLVGVLARSALTRGAYHSAASLDLADVHDLFPILRRSSMTESPEPLAKDRPTKNLLARVSLLGLTPSGLALLSDVTTSLDESYRPAGIKRLFSSIVRAARRLGEESTFESSGEQLWARIRDRVNLMLAGLLAEGALNGEKSDAFRVRCDRSTMSQNDIDNGRVVVEIGFRPAAPIEWITIVLALDEGGQVSLTSARIPEPVKEAA